MNTMSMSVNIHHAQIQPGTYGVYRNSTGELVVSLNSNIGYGGTVVMFLSDQEFDAIVNTVNGFRASEEPLCTVCGDSREWCKRGPYETDLADPEREQFSTIAVCEECGDTEVLGNLKRGLCYSCDRRESD